MATLKVFAALLLFGVVFAEDSDVIELTDDDFESGLKEAGELALVEFYAPWCGHCKRLAPEFEKAATVLKANDPPVALIKVDCVANSAACSTHGVSGYPTLKIARNGKISSDYSGPREEKGIINFMKKQVGPSSQPLADEAALKKFTKNEEASVVGFFARDDDLKEKFLSVADSLRENFRFAHTNDVNLLNTHGRSTVVIFLPPKLHSKLEDSSITFKGKPSGLEAFIKENFNGLVGVYTADSQAFFTRRPLIVAYFDLDYVKNPKGSNYWRNRVLKVAKEFKNKAYFAVADKKAHQQALEEVGLGSASGDVLVAARGAKEEKFPMDGKFSVDNLKSFAQKVVDGELEAYLKSEDVPATQGPVKVAVAKNFEELIDDSEKDVLIEFYAPWCGHCKSLEPKYLELGQRLEQSEGLVIAKMDATANDVPPAYSVQGFPTIFFRKAGASSPVKYEGGREVADFVSYLKKNARNTIVDSKGAKKSKKSKKSTKEEL